MNNSLEVGQILWLKVRYQIDVIADVSHPMLIAKITKDYIEVIAIDKTAGKMHQLFHKYNFYINSLNPKENVIHEDSYAQLNTRLTIENIEELKYARKVQDKLSSKKLYELLNCYFEYQENNHIQECRIVHMTKKEILKLNPELEKHITYAK